MASGSATIEQRNQDATLWVGGPLDERVTDDLLWELFVQAGPLVSIHMPADKVTGRHQGYAFVEYRTETDAEYASRILNLVPLFERPIKVRKASSDKSGRTGADVGANLFIGGLDPSVDETALQATFGAFGTIVDAKVMRDPDTGGSKGFGFVSFDSFEAGDAAIEAMNGQHFGGRPVVVQYAFKKDSKTERHGSAAERLLAAAQRGSSSGPLFRPHTLFAAAPGQVESVTSAVPMIGQAPSVPSAPPMLPPTAILPSAMVPPTLPSAAGLGAGGVSLPPPLPGAGGPAGGGGGGGSLMPPPLPPGMLPPRPSMPGPGPGGAPQPFQPGLPMPPPMPPSMSMPGPWMGPPRHMGGMGGPFHGGPFPGGPFPGGPPGMGPPGMGHMGMPPHGMGPGGMGGMGMPPPYGMGGMGGMGPPGMPPPYGMGPPQGGGYGPPRPPMGY